jgi:hypothetical protein
MNESDLNFLSLIASTEETTFNELCTALGDDCPEPGDKGGWRDLFAKIRDLERQCYIEVTRTAGKIDGLMLTESGAALIRDRLDSQRGLLSQMR